MTDVLAVLAIGFVAGLAAGLLGIGGGALFVPALVLFLGLSQLEAQATSLLAIVPVALVGAARQHRYGNLRVRDGLVMGVLATAGAAGGVALANALPERALEIHGETPDVVGAVRDNCQFAALHVVAR